MSYQHHAGPRPRPRTNHPTPRIPQMDLLCLLPPNTIYEKSWYCGHSICCSCPKKNCAKSRDWDPRIGSIAATVFLKGEMEVSYFPGEPISSSINA